MQAGYTWLKKRASLFSKQLMLAIGLLAVPITFWLEKKVDARPPAPRPIKLAPPVAPVQQPVSVDPRTMRLKKFLGLLRCPVAPLADEFVNAADDNHLDWRLLPSISVIESGGGKAYRNNNIFGWNQGLQLFPTITSGIREVAYKLGKSALYRNRNAVEKLRIYNPDPTYADRVLAVMHRISPVAELKPTGRLAQRNNQFVHATD